jgi:NitT/TauT family transport system ATP-binding protein
VLEKIRFNISEAEFVAIIGPSGCGKSTLLQIVAGLDPDYTGQIRWPGNAANRRLGYVFQNPRLLPWMTVRNNVRLVLDDQPGADERIAELLDTMELGDFGNYYPNRLSVGMQRRVALARAFAVEPALLLMDEPFVSLDLPTANLLRCLLLQVWERQTNHCLFVTHDLREAVQLADRILFLSHRPARLIAEVPVSIPREQRNDKALVETRFRELKGQFDKLYTSGVTAIQQGPAL